MSSSNTTVGHIVEQFAAAGDISARKMFGEYGIYCGGKLVALVCDNQLLVKPTPKGKAFIGEVVAAPPYPAAKPSLLIPAAKWDDAEWLSALIKITSDDLPAPRERKPRAKV